MTGPQINLPKPVTGASLDKAREAVMTMGAPAGPLAIRAWPELEKVFRGVKGFRCAEHYGEDETDEMLRGEIGRVGGFRIVIRWHGLPTKLESGGYVCEIAGGARPRVLRVEA